MALTENEIIFRKRYPSLKDLYIAFGPGQWRYSIEHVDWAVSTPCPSLSRMDTLYNSKGVDIALFTLHVTTLYTTFDRSGKPFDKEALTMAASIFLGKYGIECTPVKLLCYFANYTFLKSSFREFDLEDIIKQYDNKFKLWWGNQTATFQGNELVEDDPTMPKGIIALKVLVRNWLEKGEDPKSHPLYQYRSPNGFGISDELIAQVREEMEMGIF